jgi:hypothetical protein
MAYNETAIRAAIKTAMETVTDIGKVYDYQRFIEDWSQLVNIMTATIGSSTQLRGWFITTPTGGNFWREEVIGFQGGGMGGTILVTYTYRIRGFMAVDDSATTEKTMTALAMGVANAIKNNTTLQAYHFDDEVPTVMTGAVDYVMFAGVLVHYVEIMVQLQEIV